MALNGISESTRINQMLKDPDFSRSLLKATDPKLYKKQEREADKMSFLERLGMAMSFDEWADDAIWAQQQRRDAETGKMTPIKGALAGFAMPLKFAESGLRKIGGALFNSKKLGGYDDPMGKDIIPQLTADYYSQTKKGKALEQARGGKPLSYADYDTILDAEGTSKAQKTFGKVVSGGVGFAADMFTPGMMITGAAGEASKAASDGEKVIRKGLKSAGKTSLSELPKSTAKGLAKEALQKSGVKVTSANIQEVMKGSGAIQQFVDEGIQPGLYLSGALRGGKQSLVKAGSEIDTVARYANNPLFNAVRDGFGLAKKLPVGDGKTIGGVWQNLYDNTIRKNLEHGFALKQDSQALYEDVEGLRSGLKGAGFKTGQKMANLDTVLQKVKSMKELPDFQKPENMLKLREAISGSNNYTDFEALIKNMPGVNGKEKKMILEIVGNSQATDAVGTAAAGVAKSMDEVKAKWGDIKIKENSLSNITQRWGKDADNAAIGESEWIMQAWDKMNPAKQTEAIARLDELAQLTSDKNRNQIEMVRKMLSPEGTTPIGNRIARLENDVKSYNKATKSEDYLDVTGMGEEINADNLAELKKLRGEAGQTVSVVGSRGIKDKDLIYKRLDELNSKEPIKKIVSGGATGVDSIAAQWAKDRGIELEEIIPDWSKGRGAGLERNTQIVDKGNKVVAFWDGTSRGTLDSINKAKATGKEVIDGMELSPSGKIEQSMGIKLAPDVARAADINPEGFKLALQNEFELGAAKKYITESRSKIRGAIEQEMVDDWIRANKTTGQYSVAEKLIKGGDVKSTYVNTDLIDDYINEPVIEIPKKADELYTSYKPKDFKELRKRALNAIDRTELDNRVEEALGNKLNKELGIKYTPASIDSFNPLQEVADEYGTKVSNFNREKVAAISESISERYNYLNENTVKDILPELRATADSLERKAASASGEMKMIYTQRLANVKDELTVVEWIKEFGYKNLTEMVDDVNAADYYTLEKVVTDPYNIKGLKGPAKDIQVDIRDGSTKWDTFLRTSRARAQQTDLAKYEESIKNGLTNEIYLTKKNELISPEHSANFMSKLEDAYDAAKRTSSVDTGGMLTGSEETLVSGLSASSKVINIDPKELELTLMNGGYSQEGAKRISEAVISYQTEANNAQQMATDFMEWLQKAPTTEGNKEDMINLLQDLQSSTTLDFTVAAEEAGQAAINRKKVFSDVLKLENKLDEMAKLDSESATMADYFKQSLTGPMKDHIRNYTQRQQSGLTNMGVLGVGHKSMDAGDDIAPEVGKLLSESKRTIYNDPTMAAYNSVLGEDAFKTKDRVETFVKDVVGQQSIQQGRLDEIHKFTSQLIADVQDGKTGELVKVMNPSEVNKEKFVSLAGIPGLEKANIYADKSIENEIDSLVKFYQKGETNEIMKTMNLFNNMWKRIQTGGGINLPKVNGKLYRKMEDAGFSRVVDYYNNNAAFLQLSPAFTFRNFIGNATATLLGSNATAKDIPDILGNGAEALEQITKETTSETNMGPVGLLKKGGLGKDRLMGLVRDVKDSGILEGTYQTSEYGASDLISGKGLLDDASRMVARAGETNRSMDFNNNMELMWKIGLFDFERQGGKSIQQATKTVNKALFDYSALTAFERDTIKPITVFYTWTKKNIELMADMMANKPQDFMGYAKGVTNLGESFSDNNIREQMPEWTKDRAGIYTGNDEEGQFISGYGGNIESAASIVGDPEKGAIQAFDMLAPTFKLPANLLITKRNTYKDIPIEEDTSAYRYRSLPKPIKDLLGIKENNWINREGESGTTYTMDGKTKYIMETTLGRATTVPSKIASIATGDTKSTEGIGNLMTGISTNRYDLDYLKYKKEKDEQDAMMEQLKRMGLVSQYTGYGYNSKGAQLNNPEIDQYIRSIANQQ